MTKIEKSKILLGRLLGEKGWVTVNSELSGIYEKNHCYLVINYNEKSQQIVNNTIDGDFGVGSIIMIHEHSRAWTLVKEGFLITSGSLGNYLPSAYDYGMEGKDGEKALELVSNIDRFAEMSDEEIMSYKNLETFSKMKSGSDTVYEYSAQGIGNTRMFIGNTEKYPEIEEMFKSGVAYTIASIEGNSATLIPSNGDPSFSVSFNVLVKLDDAQAILAVEENYVKQEQTIWIYNSLISGSSVDLGGQFNQFGLNPAQKAILGTAISAGVNFTALLDAKRSVLEANKILDLAVNKIDVLPLVGLYPTSEQLDFLASFKKNGYQIKKFCDFSKSVEEMKKAYSDYLEGLDFILGKRLQNKDCSQDVIRLAFDGADVQKAIELCNAGNPAILVKLYSHRDEYPKIADFMIQEGVAHETLVSVPFFTLPDDVKKELMQYFFVDGAEITVKGTTIPFNQFFSESLDRAVTLGYYDRGLYVDVRNYKFLRDENSVYIDESYGTVAWRCVYANEEFIYYYSPNAGSVL